MSKPLLVLIDGNFEVNRHFHGNARLSRSDGTPTGAVYGFCQELWRVTQSRGASHIAVCFDNGKSSWRRELIEAFCAENGEAMAIYKGHRKEKDPAIVPQLELCRRAAAAYGVAVFHTPDTEADDIIATLTTAVAPLGFDVEIRTADKDMMQLVRPNVWTFNTITKKQYGVGEVIDKFGVRPELVPEVQGLTGDLIDNFKGVPSIGPVTAQRLVQEFGTLESVFDHARRGLTQSPRICNLLRTNERRGLVCRDLARLKLDLPIAFRLADLKAREPDPATLLAFLRDMEFSVLANEIERRSFAMAPAE